MRTWSLFSDGSTLHRPRHGKCKFFYNEPGAGKNARRKDNAGPRYAIGRGIVHNFYYTIDFEYLQNTIWLSTMVMGLPNSAVRSPANELAESGQLNRGNQIAVEAIGLTAADAAVLLGISESHFYCLHKTGRLGPLPVRMGRAVRWSRQELVEWFNGGSPSRSQWLVMRRNTRR